MKKKKKKKSFWIEFNNWLTRYKAIVGVAGLVIALSGLYGIWISFKGQQLIENQYINSLKPNWEIEYEYLPNNVDLIRADFHSLTPNITLQKLTFFRLDKYHELLQNDFIGNSWKANNFSNDLIDYTYTNSPTNKAYNEIFEFPEIYNWDNCYPVAFQFNYILNGEVKRQTSLYKIHFRLIKKNRLKIKGFEFVENLPNDNGSYMTSSLMNLNVNSCSGKEHYNVTKLIDSIKQTIPYYNYVDSIVHMAVRDTIISFPEKDLSYFRFPTALLSKQGYDHFMDNLNRALEFKAFYDSTIYESLKDYEKILRNNPFSENFDYSYIIETGWDKEDTYYNWRSIALRLDVQLQYACEREKRKGNTSN